MSLQTLKNKAFRVSIQWNALVRKPLSLERGGFTWNKTILNEKIKSRLKKIISNGAEGRTRTDTGLLPPDFESSVSTNSTTSAHIEQRVRLYPLIP